MIKFLTSITLAASFLSACGMGSKAQPTSQTKAIVTESQAREAFSLVAAIDYLPFNYIIDGCYARDLYMSMELAVKSIPSSAHYIYGNLHPTSTVTWRYHVAPLLKIPGYEAIILDPAFESEPLTLSSWIKHNFPSNNRYQTFITAGSAYFDDEGRASEFDNNRMVQNFEEMPSFLTSDIAAACSVMYDYIVEERENVSYKQAKLLERTSQLVSGLAAVGKLEARTLSKSDSNTVCRTAVLKTAL